MLDPITLAAVREAGARSEPADGSVGGGRLLAGRQPEFSAHGSLDRLPNPSEDCAFGFKPPEPVAMTTKLDKYHRIAGLYDALDWPFETAIYSRVRPRVFAGLRGRILDAGVVELVIQAVRDGRLRYGPTTATKREWS